MIDFRRINFGKTDETEEGADFPFLQLLVSIQKYCSGSMVGRDSIDKGIADYSLEYFKPEINDEMAGYIQNPSHVNAIFELLASFRSSEFLYADFIDAMKNKGMASDIQASDVLLVLYECSAIGHRYPSHAGQETRFTFKYRNRNSTFNKGDLIILHRGLRKALNVSF